MKGIDLVPLQGYEIDPNGTITKFVRTGIENFASKRGASKYFYHNDHLGSVNVITNSAGTRVQLNEYDPWGAVSRSEGTIDPDHRFTGQRLDPETGLYYYGGRYYDAEIGRFISADPFIQTPFDPQNLNRYSYVINNPQNYIDPDGYFHQPKKKKRGFFKSFFGYIIGAIITVVTYGAGAPAAFAGAVGGFVGGATNAALNGGNPLLGGLIGGTVGGLTGGLSPGFESPALALASAVSASNHGVLASNFAPKMSSSGSGFAPGVQLVQANAPSVSGSVSDTGPDWDWAKIIWGMAATIYSDEGGIPPRNRTWNGRVISGKLHDHHRLPRQFKSKFEDAGLDIEKFKIKIPEEFHTRLPNGVHTGPNNWNAQWAEFFENNPRARAPEILRQLDKMDREFFANIIR